MGLNEQHALGRTKKFFAVTEPTAGVFIVPESADAAKVLNVSMGIDSERRDRVDSRQSRSMLERITGKSVVTWAVDAYIIPSGTAGTPPDLDLLIKAAMGKVTNVPATSDKYELTAVQAIDTLTLIRHMPDVVMEAVRGAWVETMTINAAGGDEPRISFDGGAFQHIHTGTSTLNGATPGGGGADFTAETADGRNFHNDSVVKIGTDDNSGEGHQIITDSTRPTFTSDANISAQADALPIIPFTPTETTAGSPATMITGSFKMTPAVGGGGDVTFPITSFEVTIANGVKALDDEAMQELPTDVIPGFRAVTGSVSFRARKDFIIELGDRKDFPARNMIVVIGSGAGKTLTIDIDFAELNFADLDVPEAEEAVITVPFTALGSAGEDEIVLTFT